mmetsp:Transcript_95693/g.259767  ORF Transcript_95693/g.259767 Transcript_95693/m.259767 type:complete len:491 (+) Transcript_95693:1107-2579(+)
MRASSNCGSSWASRGAGARLSAESCWRSRCSSARASPDLRRSCSRLAVASRSSSVSLSTPPCAPRTFRSSRRLPSASALALRSSFSSADRAPAAFCTCSLASRSSFSSRYCVFWAAIAACASLSFCWSEASCWRSSSFAFFVFCVCTFSSASAASSCASASACLDLAACSCSACACASLRSTSTSAACLRSASTSAACAAFASEAVESAFASAFSSASFFRSACCESRSCPRSSLAWRCWSRSCRCRFSSFFAADFFSVASWRFASAAASFSAISSARRLATSAPMACSWSTEAARRALWALACSSSVALTAAASLRTAATSARAASSSLRKAFACCSLSLASACCWAVLALASASIFSKAARWSDSCAVSRSCCRISSFTVPFSLSSAASAFASRRAVAFRLARASSRLDRSWAWSMLSTSSCAAISCSFALDSSSSDCCSSSAPPSTCMLRVASASSPCADTRASRWLAALMSAAFAWSSWACSASAC